jgi:hypothetical protein
LFLKGRRRLREGKMERKEEGEPEEKKCKNEKDGQSQ